MARFMNKNIPGIEVPDALIAELEAAEDPVQTGIDITARFIGQVREACDGVHIMAVGAEEIVPRVLDAASLRVPSSAKEGRR